MNWRACLIVGVIVGELAGIAFAYQVLTDLECRLTGSEAICRSLRSLVARAVVAIAALSLFVWTRRTAANAPQVGPAPEPHGRHAASAHRPQAFQAVSRPRWMVAHLVGVALLLLPLLLGPLPDQNAFFQRSLILWLVGSPLATVGGLLWLAPLREWSDWLVRERYAPLFVLGFALVIPDFANVILPLWNWQALTSLTFASVVGLLSLAGTDPYSDPGEHLIGVEDFFVRIAEQCSGLEGIALTGGFVALHAVLFRHSLRFPLYWIVVLPLGLLASWMLNVLRIFALILLGARVSPEIAVNGFHSYAGWMFFTLLAVALIALVHATPALHARPGGPPGLPLNEDWLAARILPFAVFLISGTVGSALTPQAGLAFPFRALVLIAALGFFWRNFREIRYSRDPVALGAGVAVGALWVATQPADTGDGQLLLDALSRLGPIAWAAWVLLRVAGFAVLVPMVEELFFRGYLLARLDFGGLAGKGLAVALSSALFAALHGRWLEAGMAGVVFALVMIRRNRVGDAILAHVAANGLIALWAVAHGEWAAM